MKYTILTTTSQEKEKMFIPGTILWRSNLAVWANSGKADVVNDDHCIEKSEKGGWMGRTHVPGQHIMDPCITGARGGIVTFIKGEPPEAWTHLVITGAKFSKEENKRGGVLFAEFGQPMSPTDYLDFRQRMSDQRTNLLNEKDLEKVIDGARLHWPTIPTGLKRLICDFNYQTNMWEYVHIKY